MLPSPVRDVCAQIDTCAAGDRVPNETEIRGWLQDKSPAVTDGLASLIVTKQELIAYAVVEDAASGLIPRLFGIARDGSEELSRFDALQYIRAIFVTLWRRGGDSNVVHEIVLHLASLLATWPKKNADLALLVVVEHILPIPGVPALFASWWTTPVLCEVIKEGFVLAGLHPASGSDGTP